jgi:enamine deaminase RidA (YjgF/YER057c/UK114 family)
MERRGINPWGVDTSLAVYSAVVDRSSQSGCRPASRLLGVARLAFPELLIEIEATAVV